MQLPRRDLEEVASQLAGKWESLRGARILLTGATGFVGRWLVETFSFANALHHLDGAVTAVSRDPESFLEKEPHLREIPRLLWIKADLEAEDSDVSVFSERFDLAIHAAGPSARALASGGPEGVSRAVEGTRRALDIAVRAGARRFLYLSSGAVYGRRPTAPVSEGFAEALDRSDSASAYAQTKTRCEELCSGYAQRERVESIIARGFSFLGPLLPLGDKFAAGSFVQDVLRGDPVRVHGDGTPLRSYLHAGDMSVWLWTILLEGKSSRAYNVGSERPVSIAELAREAASLADPPLPVLIEGSRTASPAEDYVPSTERARSELGLEETVGWRESLRRTHDWHLNQTIPTTVARATR